MPSRVMLVEDHTLVRSGIRTLLESSREVEVIGEASDGREAVEMARRIKPDVVLMDVAMSELNGIEATRQIASMQPEIRILILSMHADEQYIFEALKAGAQGYVLKSAAVKELMNGIREVAAGRTFVSPSLSLVVMDDYVRRAKGKHVFSEVSRLTAREREVLQLIAEGKSSSEVGEVLYISTRTVETHRHHIMEKLSIHSIAGLTKFAIRNGLCSLHDRT
ncbi:MAG TPA: response regulator transcription factor [Tepidisphaeraceae bacterium]|nr:response regulator transcription factor [Tepidisphaeraceae bacterium]